MIDPTTEAADALCAYGYHTALIVPTNRGAWARQRGISAFLIWSARDARTPYEWRCLTACGFLTRMAYGRTAAQAFDRARDLIDQVAVPWDIPLQQEIEQAAHERRIMELT